ARRLAREHDIDLNQIAGTGTGGRVRKGDILAYVAQRQAAPAVATARPTSQPVQVPQPVGVPTAPAAPQPQLQPVYTAPAAPKAVPAGMAGEDIEVVTPSRMRLSIAEHMVRSKRTSPHATTVVEVDMTNIARWLEKNKDDFKKREGNSISYVPFVMKAVCEGIRKFPYMNSSWSEVNKI